MCTHKDLSMHTLLPVSNKASSNTTWDVVPCAVYANQLLRPVMLCPQHSYYLYIHIYTQSCLGQMYQEKNKNKFS